MAGPPNQTKTIPSLRNSQGPWVVRHVGSHWFPEIWILTNCAAAQVQKFAERTDVKIWLNGRNLLRAPPPTLEAFLGANGKGYISWTKPLVIPVDWILLYLWASYHSDHHERPCTA